MDVVRYSSSIGLDDNMIYRLWIHIPAYTLGYENNHIIMSSHRWWSNLYQIYYYRYTMHNTDWFKYTHLLKIGSSQCQYMIHIVILVLLCICHSNCSLVATTMYCTCTEHIKMYSKSRTYVRCAYVRTHVHTYSTNIVHKDRRKRVKKRCCCKVCHECAIFVGAPNLTIK